MNRFFVKPNQVDDQVIRIVRKDDLHHIKNVLRLKPGAYRVRVRVADADFKRASERALDVTVLPDLSLVPGLQNSVHDQNPVRPEPPADAAGSAGTTAK